MRRYTNKNKGPKIKKNIGNIITTCYECINGVPEKKCEKMHGEKKVN